MKKYFSLILVLILALTVFGCGKMNDEEAIKSTITKFFQSWEDEDIVAMGSCIDDEFSDAEISSKSEFLLVFEALFAYVDISDVKLVFSNIDISDNLATAYFSVTMTSNSLGEISTETSYLKFPMIKRGSKWLIKSQG